MAKAEKETFETVATLSEAAANGGTLTVGVTVGSSGRKGVTVNRVQSWGLVPVGLITDPAQAERVAAAMTAAAQALRALQAPPAAPKAARESVLGKKRTRKAKAA